MNTIKIFFLSLATLSILAGCGGGSSTSTVTGDVAAVNGTLVTGDGSAVAGGAVAISTTSSSSSLVKSLKDSKGHFLRLPKLTDDEGETCDDIASNVEGTLLASDCSATDGSFSLTGTIPCGEDIVFTAKKGSFLVSITKTITCPSDSDSDGSITDETASLSNDLEFSQDCGEDSMSNDCDFDIARMAVVTGNYDEIENVLAKLGFGTVTSGGVLDTEETFQFTLIDGNGSLSDVDYMNIDDFVSSTAELDVYDIIFINCGADESVLSDSAVITNLQGYVNNGGKLYATDLSWDFIEDPFPAFMDFLGNGSSSAASETGNLQPEVGTSGIEVAATVNDTTMRTWLDSVTVNDGDIETDCSSLETSEINGRTGALESDDTIIIADFLAGWAVMEAEYSGVDTTVWIQGDVTYTGPTSLSDAPLTVTLDQGSGRLLYSSYHTAHSCPTTGFWPQERVLQYLVFEL